MNLPQGDAHKYIWFRPTWFLLQSQGRMVSVNKNWKKLKGIFISSCHLLVIDISIFLSWDYFKGYAPTESDLPLVWQWLAAFHVSWRELCFFFIICYSRYLKLVVVFPKHSICQATETNLKKELAKFQHKYATKFYQKEFHSVKHLCLSNKLIEVLVFSSA